MLLLQYSYTLNTTAAAHSATEDKSEIVELHIMATAHGTRAVSTVSLIPETAECLLNCSMRSKHCSSSSACKTNLSFRLTSRLSTTGTGTSHHSSREWNQNVILLNVNQETVDAFVHLPNAKNPSL